jgi:threonine/homoserine/homoserine lactone efflux protein
MLDALFSGAVMPLETWALFVALWIGFAAFPGPNAAYAMAVGARRGDAAALAAAGGFAFGVAVYVSLVGFGLIAFLAASAELFEILRWIGVAYLVFLAWQSWHASSDPVQAPVLDKREAGGIAIRAALITLTNPKSALTYVLVYSPFMTAATDTGLGLMQLILLGATSVTLSFINYAVYGLLAGRMGRLIKTKRQAMIRNRTFAILFAGAGAALAWTSRR